MREPGGADPPRGCARCPRLFKHRAGLKLKRPEWRNEPVGNFGEARARLLITGLAPGAAGANRTGRPFTGDSSGRTLFSLLFEFGFACGTYADEATDDLKLCDALVTNAVRCVPPRNKPLAAEIAACRPFLVRTINQLENLCAILALGRIAHDSVIAALSLNRAEFAFAHGAEYELPAAEGRKLRLFDSYHCSRYNMNTGVVTVDMLRDVLARTRERLDREPSRAA